MNNLDNKGENLLRDKLQQHEFAVDEAAWEKMDALLSERSNPLPPPITPMGRSGLFGRKWLLGLISLGLAGWWLVSFEPHTAALPNPIGEAIPPRETGRLIMPVKDDRTTDSSTTGIRAPSDERVAVKLSENQDGKTLAGPKKNKLGLDSHLPISSHNQATARDEKAGINTSGKAAATRKMEITALQGLGPSPTGSNANRVFQPQITGTDSALGQPLPPGNGNFRQNLPLPAVPQRYRVLAVARRPWLGLAQVPWTPRYHPHRFQIGVVAGGQLARVQHDPYNSAYAGSPTFGLSVNYRIKPRWSLEANLLYRMVPHRLQANFSQSGLEANGVFSYLNYQVMSNDLEFIEMPLLIKRAFFNDRVHLLSGFRPAIVRPVHNLESGSYAGQYASSGFSPTIREGVRRFDLAVTLGGEVRICRNLWLQARVSQGLFDLTYDDFFQNTDTDVTTDVQLTLHYYFISF